MMCICGYGILYVHPVLAQNMLVSQPAVATCEEDTKPVDCTTSVSTATSLE